MTKPTKLDRKALKTPDKFMQRGQAALGVLANHRNTLYIGLGIFIVVLVGYYGYGYWTDRKQDSAWKIFEEANKAAEAQRWDKLKGIYPTLVQSRPKFLTAIALADHYFDESKKEALKTGGNAETIAKNGALSVEWYSKALDYGELLPFERQLVLVNRGGAQELLKKWDEALADYQKASEITGEAKGVALLGVGRAWELKNDNTKAIAAYEKVTIEMGGSEFGKMAKNFIRRLKSPLLKSSPSKG